MLLFSTARQKCLRKLKSLTRLWSSLALYFSVVSYVSGQDYIIQKLPLFPERSDVLVRTISQDNVGFIWYLHNAEIYRFDGYRSLSILPTIEGYDALEDTPQKILVDKQNRLWIVGMEQIAYLDLATWKLHVLQDVVLPDTQDKTVFWIKEMKDGTIMTAYENGWIVLYQNGKTTSIDILYRLSVLQNNSISPEVGTEWQGQYCIATSAGSLLLIDPANNNAITNKSLSGVQQAILNAVPFKDQLLIDVFRQGTFLVDKDFTVHPFELKGVNYQPNEKHLFIEADNHYLYADNNSVAYFDAQFEPIKVVPLSMRLQQILFNQDKVIIGVDVGIYMLYQRSKGIGQLIPCNGEESKSMRGLHVFKDGSIFFGGYGGAGYTDEKGNCFNYPYLTAYCMLPYSDHEVLIGTEGGGLMVFDKRTQVIRPFPLKLSEEAKKKYVYNRPAVVFSMIKFQDSYLLGSTRGLWQVNTKDNMVTPIDIRINGKLTTNLQIKHILALEEEKSLLLSTQFGLLKVNMNGEGSMFYPQQGSTLVYKAVYAQDTIWVATQGKGLVAVDKQGNFLKNWTKADGLSDNTIFSLEIIDRLKVLGTADGLSLMEGGSVWHLNTKDGIQHPEFNSGASYWDESTRKLYLGGLKGYVVLEPDSLRLNANVENSYIAEVHIASTNRTAIKKDFTWPYTGRTSINLSPAESIAGIYLGSPANYYSNVTVQYKIKNRTWNTLSPGQFISFPEPAVGEYPIMFETSNKGLNKSFQSILVRKLPAFYQTWWFLVLCVLGIIGGIVQWYRYKFSKISREQAIRNRIAEDLHDEVGGLLTGISMQVELLQLSDQTPKQSKILTRLSKLSKEVLSSMNDVVWSLNSRNDGWQNLVDKLGDFGLKLFEASNARFSMQTIGEIPKHLSHQERQAVYLLIREALHNSCKHAEATQVHLQISFGRRITITLTDDGKGFDVASKNKGNGIRNMTNRAASIGANFIIDSTHSGTTITLQFTPKHR